MASQASSTQSRGYDARSNDGREDWEDWEDEDAVTPIVDTDEPLDDSPIIPNPHRPSKVASSRASVPRYSVQKLKRLKSRQRQKAQNAKLGIKLVTDVSKFRRQPHIAHQIRSPERHPPKFVDAAALKALEGSPNSASVGNWNWLKRKPSDHHGSKSPQKSGRSPIDQDLSPDDRPIVIGFELPSDRDGHEISPQTAIVQTPLDLPMFLNTQSHANKPTNLTPLTPSQHKSVWSPDTPDTASSFQSSRPASSVYSQSTTYGGSVGRNAPPVPAVPSNYKKQERVLSVELKDSEDNDDDDDGGSPCTLFEEDGVASNSRKSAKVKVASKSPDSASTTRGWWDHVTTPFTDKKSPIMEQQRKSPVTKNTTPEEWWAGTDMKAVSAPKQSLPASPRPSPRNVQTPIVRVPSPPRRTPSPYTIQRAPSSVSSSRPVTPRPQVDSEKTTMFVQHSPMPTEQPPPYSPPHKQTAIKYRAVFPTGHPLQALYPPSPGPISPGIAGTMTSQGAISLTDIPLTPARTGSPASLRNPLPQRQMGTYVPQEHSLPASGPAHRIERERRRHEKEEVIARKAGGFWKGRWCMPLSGCYGRTGREGRKRRRVYFGICGGVIAAIILIVVLCVTLIPKNSGSADIPSIFVNLTNYPPMPTGVLTVVGPDNPVAVTGCTQPTTLWSCALPKEQHESAAPFSPNQPTIIMRIQWDNSTQELWNVPNGQPPQPDPRQSSNSAAARAVALVRSRQASATTFTPNPAPPSFQEMFFLGNTTDGIVSDEKAGEPTPFYLSILRTVNDTVGAPGLAKRQSSIPDLPAPDLNPDGTGAPAQLFPLAFQQPIRLFDRGLPTEHYGFYTYFKRSIYLKSVTALNETANDSPVPLDEDGGARETEAKFITTWSQTRFLVQIWTRAENTSQLLSGRSRFANEDDDDAETTARPGTMPYPVTIKTDTHGGTPDEKFVWHWPVDDRQRIDASKPKLFANNIGFGGTLINKRSDRNKSFGGFDGGSGGCKCEWVNFLAKRPVSNEGE